MNSPILAEIKLSQIFDYPTPQSAGIIVAKTIVVYIFLVAGLRLLGKRELGQMNIYDLVLIVILGNAVQNAMVNNDNTLCGGIICAITLLLLNKLFNVLMRRSKKIEVAMIGQPLLIANHGKVSQEVMNREGISHEQLDAALREHGIEHISDTRMCVLEVDGTISVVPKDSKVMKTKRHYRGIRLP